MSAVLAFILGFILAVGVYITLAAVVPGGAGA